MASDDFLDPDSWPLILEELDPSSSSQNQEHLDQLNQNPDSTFLGRSPTPRSGAYVQSHANRALETSISPRPTFSSGDRVKAYNDGLFSWLFRREEEREKEKLEDAYVQSRGKRPMETSISPPPTFSSEDRVKAYNDGLFSWLHRREEEREKQKLEAAYVQSRGKRPMETSISPPPTFSNHDRVKAYNNELFSQQRRRWAEEWEKQKLEGAIGSTGLYNTQRQSNQNSPPVRKRRFDVNKVKIEYLEQLLPPAPKFRGFRPPAPEQLLKQNTRGLVSDICSHRLQQYLSHMRDQTHGNDISYWKKFVSEYYAPGSNKKWCFSKYQKLELRPAVGTYFCRICGAKPWKGFEASSETLARLFKMKFDSGMLDEILYTDVHRAYQVREGLLVLHAKAVQTSVYNGSRVVHNGQLRVVFRHNLKILSWEFCIANHEEYVPRLSFAPQVKQLKEATEKSEHIQNHLSSQTSLQDLRQVRDMCVSAGTQIAKKMELSPMNKLGYPKLFFRGLKMSEVFDIMKYLIDFSLEKQMGAIDCLKNYPRGRNIRSQGTGPPVHDNPVTVNDARLVLESLCLGSRTSPAGDEAAQQPDQTRTSSSNAAAAARTGQFRRPGNR